MTLDRREQIEQDALRAGAANCWTGTSGTLAWYIMELLGELKAEPSETENAERQEQLF